jgi:hypothetical protein
MTSNQDSEDLIIENTVHGEVLASEFGHTILSENVSEPDVTLKLMVRFRAAGQVLSAFAETRLRLLAGDDEEAQKQARNVLARVDAIVADAARKGDSYLREYMAQRNAEGN